MKYAVLALWLIAFYEVCRVDRLVADVTTHRQAIEQLTEALHLERLAREAQDREWKARCWIKEAP